MTHIRTTCYAVLLAVLLVTLSREIRAQEPMLGFSAASSSKEAGVETRFKAIPSPQ
jgi:hypothetical protein